MRDWQKFFTIEDGSIWQHGEQFVTIEKANRIIREVIAAAPKLYAYKTCADIYSWNSGKLEIHDYVGELVNMRRLSDGMSIDGKAGFFSEKEPKCDYMDGKEGGKPGVRDLHRDTPAEEWARLAQRKKT